MAVRKGPVGAALMLLALLLLTLVHSTAAQSDIMRARPGCEHGACAFCTGFRHEDKRTAQFEFVSSATSDGDSGNLPCECSATDALQLANVTTPSAKQCDPIVLCKVHGTTDVCVCHELPLFIPSSVRHISVVSDNDDCIRGDGSNGLAFGLGPIGPGWLLLIFLGVAGLCGMMVYSSEHTTTACEQEPKWFLVIEFLDATADIGSLAYSLATHDLRFSNDDGLVRTTLTVSVGLSVLMFLYEIYLHRQGGLERWIPILLCLHMVTEDFFQTFVYLWVGGTHFLGSMQEENEEVCDKGALCPGFAYAFAIAQAVTFTSVKMWELWQEEEGAGAAVRQEGDVEQHTNPARGMQHQQPAHRNGGLSDEAALAAGLAESAARNQPSAESPHVAGAAVGAQMNGGLSEEAAMAAALQNSHVRGLNRRCAEPPGPSPSAGGAPYDAPLVPAVVVGPPAGDAFMNRGYAVELQQVRPPALPHGWEATWDAEQRRWYYSDHNTNTTSWDPPPGYQCTHQGRLG